MPLTSTGKFYRETPNRILAARGPALERLFKMIRRDWALTLILASLVIAASGLTSATGASAKPGFVGVILPDATTGTRWESADRPLLTAAFKAANVKAEIENADGDVAAFQTIADQMLADGVKVLMLVNLDSASAKAVQDKAKKRGVPTIDYDRLTLKGSQSFYVSYNDILVGRLQGQSIKSCLNRAHKKKARIVYLNGPSDNLNANLMKKGYDSILRPLIKSKLYTLVDDSSVMSGDNLSAGTIFAQQLIKADGKLDAVVAPSDAIAIAAITALNKTKLNGKVCVSGGGASIDGLRAILTGDLASTVYEPIKAEAYAAANLAVALFRGNPATAATSLTNNGLVNIPSLLLKPIAITRSNIKIPVADGFQRRAAVCIALEALCKRYRI